MITTSEALKAEIDSLQKQLAETIKRYGAREYELATRIRDLSEQLTASLLREGELREANEYLRNENARLKQGLVRVPFEGVVK